MTILCWLKKIFNSKFISNEKEILITFSNSIHCWNYWIDLFGRGKGAIYVKDKNPLQDSWRLKEFGKVGSYTEFTNIPQVQ